MKKYENFVRAYNNLKSIYDYEKPYGNVELTGLVGLFEICFEQSWKAMKEVLLQSGFDEGKTGSPRMVIKTAFSSGMIDDEDVWLDALSSRNDVAHSYKEDIALGIIKLTKDRYYDMFGKLKDKIEKEWL